MDRRLGRPLPHQLPNPTRADPLAINLSSEELIRYYSPFPGAIPNQRVRSHALLTRPPLGPKTSFDLHVLGLPPAFILSQDQTLKLKCPERHILDVEPSHICLRPRQETQVLTIHVLKIVETTKNPQTVKLSPGSSGRNPTRPICETSKRRCAQTAHISLHHQLFKEQRRKTTYPPKVSARLLPCL